MTKDQRDAEARLTTLAGAWLLTHRSWNTRAAYEADLAWFAAWCDQSGRSPLRAAQADVEQFCADSQAQGDGAAVTRRRLSALTSFFDHAVAAGDMTDNPAEQVQRPMQAAASPPAELDQCEAEALLEAAYDLGPKAAVLVTLLLVDGLKLGEALAIDIDDLRADPSTVTVTRQGRRESLALHTTTAAAIATYTHGRLTGPLLAGNDAAATRLTRSGAHQILKRASTSAGITKSVSANTLRRYFASSAYRDGASVDDIRASLGVGERRTTRRLLPKQP
ncbi:MAG: tyrosine-type recombinase/integrase [Acidimicrobiia bacterium]